ncbi:LOW QUALITY PROTEIN: SUN domain-containing protein 1-like [Brachionichthys hirsutus]|uniref:LOW QUALITY PROTEIN: SUN domain-containing protein 1-like n=1 Tax=Brachionichthys hirsutus TaxID=412623 RepID=UPI0036050E32
MWRPTFRPVVVLSSHHHRLEDGSLQRPPSGLSLRPHVPQQPTSRGTVEDPPPGEEEAFGLLVHLERRLAALWERVDAGGRQAEQRHQQLLELYAELQQQVGVKSHGSADCWTRTRMFSGDQKLLQETLKRLSAGAARLIRPLSSSVGADRHSHRALLAEVARLEAALEDIRGDVDGLSSCQEVGQQLDTIQQKVSEEVSSQVQTLIYGNRLTVGGRPPGDVLRWLSRRYVSRADLQASLVSLELGVLQNISLQLEQRRGQEASREKVRRGGGAACSVFLSDVDVIVKDALRLFSQDRTGLADFALESGGGSVLTSRCSQSYQTKAALLSVFGVPLWYFSQSPRAVIQPDVHPGNCWAFRGSRGFLAIRLSMPIFPTAFSLEHVPKALTPRGTLLSAPRDFSVFGLEDEEEERGKLLGSYSYDEDGESVQMFAVTEGCDRTFQVIEVQVLSNWGHPDFTCMYRFRVHGTPQHG